MSAGTAKAIASKGLVASVEVRAIELPTVFRDFNDYWQPFLGRQGAAPAYLASLPCEAQEAIRDTLKARIAADAGGAITMTARAWAVRGVAPLPEAPLSDPRHRA